MDHKLKSAFRLKIAPGDVLIDRRGNEMIVVEVLNHSTGDCYALYNGEVKLVNALKSSVVVPDNKKLNNAKT